MALEAVMKKLSLATSFADTQTNIRRYQKELSLHKPLRSRVSYVRAWYVSRGENGQWLFAPSKFVGYKFSSAADYLKDAGQSGKRDGRETERLLADWYHEVDADTQLGRELFAALRAFLAEFHQTPNKLARINISSQETLIETKAINLDILLAQITTNPEICGGRPIVRGTRMRVTDIVEMIAHGATREEILEDFDYLTDDDITAALLYAARASDHRVIRAA